MIKSIVTLSVSIQVTTRAASVMPAPRPHIILCTGLSTPSPPVTTCFR